MKTITILALGVAMSLSNSMYSQESQSKSKFSTAIIGGYNGGFGANLSLTAHKPVESLPIDVRFGIGYTSLDPGDSADARRIFINNATNGVPEEKGRTYDYRLDALWPVTLIESARSYIVFGPRYSSFRGNFKYVGGNEDFDVTTKQFGAGLGAESHFKMNASLDLLVAIGLDYYFDSTLKGHDTQYSPDDDNVNAQNDNQNDNVEFTYNDADEAINQPDLTPRVMIGISYHL